MALIDLHSASGKLNDNWNRALMAAIELAQSRSDASLELAHWFLVIMQASDSDLHKVLQAFGIDHGALLKDLQASFNKLRKRSGTAQLEISPDFDDAIQQGVLYATLRYNAPAVRGGHIILGCLEKREARSSLMGISQLFKKIDIERLADEMDKITAGSPEDGLRTSDGAGLGSGSGDAGPTVGPDGKPAAGGKGGKALDKFCTDLTAQAREGKMDPVLGRDQEIRQCIDILMRRRQNNPILTGEPGVGKTAVAEGFAQRIALGDVPPQLKDVRLLALDLGLLQAGAGAKGEFENRLRGVIDEVQASSRPIILFIDEAHTLIGAGGQEGQNDAANLLKPALARGTLRTIAATTQSEYKKYFEKDPALTRRFQVVKVDEPDEAKALLMIRGVATKLEQHFKIIVLDEAMEAAVRLSKRYIQGRQLPDKAVSLIDTACSRVAVSQSAIPPEMDDCKKRIDGLTNELAIIDREIAVGQDHNDRRAAVVKTLDAEKSLLATIEARFNAERDVVSKVLDLRGKLRASSIAKDNTPEKLSAAATATMMEELKGHQTKLAEMQGENPLILPSVDAAAVGAVISDWTGIPVGRMVRNEVQSILNLAETLNKRVVGQRHGLEQIASRIQLSRAKLDNPGRPVGVFMLVGPSGVGKTETAVALAETLYGGPQALITINMSEYQEAHKVSTLMGSPPGYVGYGKGGVLTEAVRRRPYSVVLLDEVEKAHADVHEVFFQVFDKGMMKDSEGVDIDFKNTIVLLTSNVGTDVIMKLCADPALKPDADALGAALREPLLKVFPPALLGRINVIPYYPISDEMMRSIIGLQMGRIAKRVAEGHKVPFSYDPEVVDTICSRVTELDSGARAIDAIITRQMLPAIGEQILKRMVAGEPFKRIHVSAKNGEFEYSF